MLLCIWSFQGVAQSGVIRGRVFDKVNNEELPFANLMLQPGGIKATSDIDGTYVFENLEPGNYNLEVRYASYQATAISDIPVSNAKETEVNVGLKTAVDSLQELVIVSPFTELEEAPVSLRNLSAAEIERFPGANRDVSKVVQSLPGVSPQPGFRNDIVIRGGAPNENRFFLDHIEVPNINHFATQGSSGGPVGLININFIRSVDFYTGAFPTMKGNALSSVLDFKQKDPAKDKFNSTFTLGSSDVGITFDTPLSEKTGLIFSARRSYLQFLFQALKLPFLPTYNDAQFKLKHKFDDKNELTIIGLGAIDNFNINTSVNDGVTDESILERNNFILGNIPVQEQWNYTVGAKYRRYRENGYHTFILSRNQLSNSSTKYLDNDESDDSKLLLDYVSRETETKFRYENLIQKENWKITYGAGLQHVNYTNATYNKIFTQQGPATVDFDSEMSFQKYALFGQLSREWRRLTLSFGLRTDIADYGSEYMNPLDQLSPRISASYKVAPKWSVNGNWGMYSQLPAYTILGYRDSLNQLANRDRTGYIDVSHYVLGVKYDVGTYSRLSIEGFYKDYSNYPFSIRDSISLANLGADFGVIGNEPINSTSEGRSYGLEFLFQQKLSKGFYGIVAYTLVRSEFKDKNDAYIPSAWDNRHVVSLTGGKKFKKNWDLGLRWLFSGGAPYTPFDLATSSLRASWDVRGQGLLDYNRLNSERLGVFHQLDIRVDKRFYFKKWSLNLYLDIQNMYAFAAPTAPFLIAETDADGNPIVDPNDSSRYLVKTVDSSSGSPIPTIGIIAEF